MSEVEPTEAAGRSADRTASIWRRELTPWLRSPRSPRPLPAWAYWLAVVLFAAGTLLGATLFTIYVDLAIDPDQLALPRPRPGATWTTHSQAWRAVLVLLALLVVTVIFLMAMRTLLRLGQHGIVACGANQRLGLKGAAAVVSGGSLLFVVREVTNPAFPRLSWSPARISVFVAAGVLFFAGAVVSNRLGRSPSSANISFRAGATLAGLSVLVAAGVVADFYHFDYPGTPPSSTISGSFPNDLLATLSGDALTPTPLVEAPDWASVGFATFSATNPNLSVETGAPVCFNDGCLVLGTGYGGYEALALVTPSATDWRAGVIRTVLPSWLACAALTRCLTEWSEIGPGLKATSDGGRSWSTVRLPKGVDGGLDIYGTARGCRSGRCAFLGTSTPSLSARRRCGCDGSPLLVTSRNWGSGWRTRTIPLPLTGLNQLSGLSCPTADRCLAVGELDSRGVVFRTNDGGHSWQKVLLPAGSPPPVQVACAGADRCVEVGTSVFGTRLSRANA